MDQERCGDPEMNTLINCLKGPAGFLGKLFVNDNDEYSLSARSHHHHLCYESVFTWSVILYSCVLLIEPCFIGLSTFQCHIISRALVNGMSRDFF